MRALQFITGHVTYNPAYTYKFQLKTTINLASFSTKGFSDTFAITKPPSTTTIELVGTSA